MSDFLKVFDSVTFFDTDSETEKTAVIRDVIESEVGPRATAIFYIARAENGDLFEIDASSLAGGAYYEFSK